MLCPTCHVAGAVYIYSISSTNYYLLTQKLALSANSGMSVSFDYFGSTLVVGAPWTAPGQGVYVFRRNADGMFAMVETLVDDEPTSGGGLGISVATSASGRTGE